MQIQFKIIFYLLLLNFASCAPMHIKEYQAEGVKGRCGYGSTGAYIPGTELTFYTVTVARKGNDSVVEISMQGKDGDDITVLEPTITVVQDGKARSVEIEVSTRQFNKKNPQDGPRSGSWKIGSPYVFRSDEVYGPGWIILEGHFPFNQEDLVIETGKIKLGKQMISPKSIKFKFVDRWTIVPFNGC